MTQPSQQPWRSSLRSGAVYAALFLLLGVSHVLPALHFALVAHRVCAEHGELLHDGSEPEPVASLQGDRRAPDTSVLSPLGGNAHAHEHCGVVAVPGSFAAPEALRGAACLLPEAWAASLPGGARSAHVEIALLLYAPKLAPPV